MEKVAELHRKVRRRRLDHAHKTALGPVGAHGVIGHEDFKIPNVSEGTAPKSDLGQPGAFLPNGAAAKAKLNTSINGAAWGFDGPRLHPLLR
ncbi:hypothetical protein ACFYSF_40195 [Streptomyces canus]|uniref:hypothetical protein n=1 Tax=Streptomyces canus TaxID=58343 RepID=UPI003675865A